MPMQQMLLGAGAAAKKTYIDDLFSTYLHTGTREAATVNNGIDLSGEGGLVWSKGLDTNGTHNAFIDTERGIGGWVSSNLNGNSYNSSNQCITSFNSNGYSLGTDGSGNFNYFIGESYLQYTFRKAPGFFDIVTWTGNGTANRKISHSLGSVPGSIWIKRLSGTTGTAISDWVCYHRMSNEGSYPWNYLLFLNRNIDPYNDSAGNFLYNVAPASDEFTIGSHQTVNNNGDTYVAYVFAHNDQQFGSDENKDIIQCGGYTGNGSDSGPNINLGWEPQWILIKRTDANENWFFWDSMRGIVTGAADARLITNSSGPENDSADRVDLTSTGFIPKTASGEVNANNGKYVYICIRRSDGYVGKPPELGTDVFNVANYDSTAPAFNANFDVDFAMFRRTTSTYDWRTSARLIQKKYLKINTTDAEENENDYVFDYNEGWNKQTAYANTEVSWQWKRHAGFDVVTYKGNGTSGTARNHSLNKTPEMIWCKDRGSAYANWMVYHKGLNGGTDPEDRFIYLNQSDAELNNSSRWGTLPTSSVFYTGSDNSTNGNGQSYVAMLFASVDGISKVGYYDGSDSSQTITTGFQPRFWIVKSTTDAYPWLVLDTLRGWGSGNDKYLALNSSDAEQPHDFGAPTSTGFTMTSSSHYNKSGKKYIYYAHA